MKTKIPTMSPAPEHWSDYTSILSGVQASAAEWNSIINASLLAVPKSASVNLADLSKLCQTAIRVADDLQADPQSDYLKKQLANKINYAQGGIDDVIQEINGLIDKLNTFKENMPEQARNLAEIARLMLSDKGTDENQVKTLQADINALNNQIDDLTNTIIALGIVDALALTISGVAVFAAGPMGMISWVFTGAAIVAASTYIALDADEIKACKKKIENDAQQMDEFNKVIAVLQCQSESFSKMSEEMTALQENLKQMLLSWQQIQIGLQNAETEILTAGRDYTAEDWKSVAGDFTNAKNKTDDLIKEIKKVDISELKGSTAQITPGMSETEVEAAANQAETLPMVEYIRKLA